MTAEVPPTRWRVLQVLPIVDQLRGYQSAWLRGDLVAGVVVAALIIPKNLGYAEIAGVPLENGLYAAAAGTILYALFGSCRQISMGPSSGLAAVAGGAVLADRADRSHRRGHPGRRDHADERSALPGPRRVQDGVAVAVPLPGRRHRVPLRCRHRRRHRGAAQADRAPTATAATPSRSSGRGCPPSARRTPPRWWSGSWRSSSSSDSGGSLPRSPAPWSCWSAASSRRAVLDLAATAASPWSGTSPAGCRPSTCPTSDCWWTMPARSWWQRSRW